MRDKFTYSEEHRSNISFPLGGMGSGCIGLAGNGGLTDWEIFNRPSKGSFNGLSHFSLKVDDGRRIVDARVLNGDMPMPYTGQYGSGKLFQGFGFGPQRETIAGLPHFQTNTFRGEFPMAQVRFSDEGFPGHVSMEAFNPFIPHAEDDSSIPAAFFTITIENTWETPLDYYVTSVIGNPYDGITRNTFSQSDGISRIMFDSLNPDPEDVAAGNLTMATDSDDVSFQEYLFRGTWFDAMEVYWKDMTKPGHFQPRTYEPADGAVRDNGLLSARIRLEPGEKRNVRYVLSWSHPINKNTWGRMKAGRTTEYTPEEKAWLSKTWKNYYAILWPDSKASSDYALQNWNRLQHATMDFKNALFDSSLPTAVLDAVSANLSVLKSPTVWRLEDGTLYGWEGCDEKIGSCEGSCTHVWAYAQALPFLFPALSRSMRQAEYDYNWAEDGSLTFRLMLPVGSPRWHFRPAADGQFATVMKTYREWRISGDDGWLKSLWPKVKKSLEFAWSPENSDLWDPDKTGVLTGRQHHTLDMELFGPNSWLTGMYLGAIKACSEMALAMGDDSAAEEYGGIFRNGSRYVNEKLFNGEYFFHEIDFRDKSLLAPYADKEEICLVGKDGDIYDVYWSDELGELKYQIGHGVGIDQVLGQWHADLYGLGDIFEPDKIRSALASLMKHNFRVQMRDHYNPCRLFCLNDESGLVICSWPEDSDKPSIPAPYSQETMHGFEYAAADMMMRRGLLEDGLKVVRSIRDRYDGQRRNPWNEMECGSNYARSMASYALLLTYSGFSYDGRCHHIGFSPIIQGDISYLWSFGEGWGQIRRRGNQWKLDVLGGSLRISQLGLDSRSVTRIVYKSTAIGFRQTDRILVLDSAIRLRAADCLIVELGSMS